MKDKEESLEERAKKLDEEAKSFSKKMKSKEHSKEQNKKAQKKNNSSLIKEISALNKFINNTKNSLGGFYDKIISPVVFIFGPPLKWIGSKYSSLWSRFAYKGEEGNRILSRKKAGSFILVTLLFLFALTPTKIGNIIRYFTVEPVFDTVLMLTSKTTGEFYLNHSEEILPEENIHSVRGCNKLGHCTEEDAVYFRVRPRLAHDAWKLINYGNPFYIPDHVVAPIAPGVNKCQVTYYGYRMTASFTSRLMRSMQVYPTLLETDCEFISGSSAGEG